MQPWRRRGPIEANEKAGSVTFTQLQRDARGNLVFVEDWINTQPSWWGFVMFCRAIGEPVPLVRDA